MQITVVYPYFLDTIYATGLEIHWVTTKDGAVDKFGDIFIYVDEDNKVTIDTASMGKDHFMKLMELLYDMAEVK